MGKSHLASEVAEQASRRGAVTLWGAAYEHRHQVPYGPIAAALEGFALRLAPETLEALLDEAGSLLGCLSPTIAATMAKEQHPAVSPDPAALAAALLAVLSRVGEQAPVVVQLENLQVADEATLHLLEHLAPRIPDSPILLLGTASLSMESGGASSIASGRPWRVSRHSRPSLLHPWTAPRPRSW